MSQDDHPMPGRVQKGTDGRRHGAASVAMAALSILLGACGGGDDRMSPAPLGLECTGAVAIVPDQIGFQCGAPAVDRIDATVAIGGPTTAMNIYGIKFDLVFDSLVLRFEPQAVEGTFLSRDGAATILQADVAPLDPGRLVVAVTRQANAGGIQAIDPIEGVATFFFRGFDRGTSALAFENAEVVDPIGNVIGITFAPPVSVTVD